MLNTLAHLFSKLITGRYTLADRQEEKTCSKSDSNGIKKTNSNDKSLLKHRKIQFTGETM